MGPDVSLEDSRRGKAPAALHTLKGSFSRMRPGGSKNEIVMHKTVGLTFFYINNTESIKQNFVLTKEKNVSRVDALYIFVYI